MHYRSPRAALQERYDTLGHALDRADAEAARIAGEQMALRQERAQVESEIAHHEEPRFPAFARMRIASPCGVKWETMSGDDRVRFCGDCRKHVYNVSAMTRAEVEALLGQMKTSPCVRYFERVDGTIITQDCPVGVQRKERRKLALAVLGGTVMWGATMAGAASLASSLVQRDADADIPGDPGVSVVMPPAEVPIVATRLDASGFLKITGTDGSRVEIDGFASAALPAAIMTLRPGLHTVKITYPWGLSVTDNVEITPGQTTTRNFSATPPVVPPILRPPNTRDVAGGMPAPDRRHKPGDFF